MESTPETDKATLFFCYLSAASTCIICHRGIADTSNKRKLWKENEKSKICSELELYFGDAITRKNFSICLSMCKIQLKAKQEKEASFHEGRK